MQDTVYWCIYISALRPTGSNPVLYTESGGGYMYGNLPSSPNTYNYKAKQVTMM